ncbi:class I SAM-dependent DNA methyltransferase [Brevundimonas sp. Root1279]|uniref:class I SAM-dependent DNA methyltransferase n=1 Tax=Brevundimonas sp. Root1279 TaxID=1736443 RepID=UPI0006FCEFB7|nr:DNA methyltransferase [Brevundimonas sp. Root1279]KQW82445.1 restriction endonuclease subunit M [Brevundimonas sp. Root1279]
MDINAFIDRWSHARGGAERANYQMFLSELCEALELPRPDPASDDTRTNDYVFERGVKRRESEGFASTLRIDLYKRGCFILEAKQSRAAQRDDQPRLFSEAEANSTAAGEGRWDTLMRNARKQAEDYVFRLPADHAAPPFIIVCDVGYVFEIYADFSGSGRAYTHFPDRKGFRVRLEDLRDDKVVERLRAIWTDPQSLDPTRESARVTRQIAERLAAVSRRLERNHPAEEVAHFLMRCIFTMFAEDVDLLPKGKFTELLNECLEGPDSFAPLLRDLWRRMDDPVYDNRFFSGFKTHLRHFNGSLFKDARAFPMTREEIGELLAASRHDWRYVEPAIFGTLVEQALDPKERRALGAHYTPRSYVERLVEVTVMEPLRADWNAALMKAGDARERGAPKEAVAAIRAFHHQLCATRVLDPACGTGNFLYVSLELMKRLEGEVLEALAELGETEGIGFETVDPHQFLGIELNVRAAAIAELVLWIGYLQQHYRNSREHPAEPILKAFGNIQQKDAVLTWDGYPELQFEMVEGKAVQVYPNARRPDWPEAEFIVGNPPFIGGKDLRSRMEFGYAEALWRAHRHMNESADFVMYWWDRAAELLTRKKTPLRRFGFVTTNSISQMFQRKVMERHLNAKTPLSLIFAVPDHPWTKATKDSAAVRIAMTVCVPGSKDGELLKVEAEAALDTDDPTLTFIARDGKINPDLTAGVDVTRALPLLANQGVSSPGVKLHGAGFIVTSSEAELIGLGHRQGLERHIRHYRNGRDLTARPRGVMVIDLFGLSATEVRMQYPEVYQHLYDTVRVDRLAQVAKSPTKDAQAYAEQWWQFGKPRTELRPALEGLPRYVATVETAQHRTFQFLDASILPDNRLVCFAWDDAAFLAVLSSRGHVIWALATGGLLEDRPIYTKSKGFDPFPFPDPSDAVRARLRELGEELDATRKTVQAEHPDLTLTGLYNVLEKVRAGTPLDPKDEDVKDRGRVLILKDLHDQIDRATADAYGWRHDLTDEQILEKLVALNAERAAEEAAGHVRWLRPDYQIPRFAKGATKAKSGELDLADSVVAIDKGLPAFPKDKGEQVMAIRAVLQAAGKPMDAAAVSRAFKRGGKAIEQRVLQALNTLVRYAEITALPDGTYAARRAA